MQKLKKVIPNILTFSRIIVTPLLIILGIKGYYEELAIICIIVALTDCFDGKLARKFGVCSEFGAKLDTIGDKLLAISLLSILVIKKKIFLYLLIFEALIAIVNIILYLKTRATKSLMIGKIKTWVLYTTIIFGIVNIFFPKIHIMMNIGIVLSLIFQFLSLIAYTRNYYLLITKKKRIILYNEFYSIVNEILEHKEFQKRKDYAHHYNESVYDHCLKVGFDAFRIAKKYKLDYKSAAIAGVLHDFYDKPWQDDTEKKPLLKRHGFVHAHEAKENSKKYFDKFMNKKIENSIERHMFPLNKIPPKYLEGWLIVLVDKLDSMDFLIHPSVFMKCFITKKGKK